MLSMLSSAHPPLRGGGRASNSYLGGVPKMKTFFEDIRESSARAEKRDFPTLNKKLVFARFQVS